MCHRFHSPDRRSQTRPCAKHRPICFLLMQMPDVRIADRRIWVGDEDRVLLAGEVHYWRLDPVVWPAVLRRSRELGLEVLSTYVCWDFHEIAPGEFDFDGQTTARRDLVAFLELVRSEG